MHTVVSRAPLDIPLADQQGPSIPPFDLTVNSISLAWRLLFGISIVTSCVGIFFVVFVFYPTLVFVGCQKVISKTILMLGSCPESLI